MPFVVIEREHHFRYLSLVSIRKQLISIHRLLEASCETALLDRSHSYCVGLLSHPDSDAVDEEVKADYTTREHGGDQWFWSQPFRDRM